MSRSRPPSPPSHGAAANTDVSSNSNIEVTIVPSSPGSSSSTDSASGSASPRGISRKSSTSAPTNTLIVTPLPLAFFEPRILDALKSHFASFSTTFIHRTSPQSPVSAPGPGASIKGTRPMTDAEKSSGDIGQTGSGDEQVVDEHSVEGDLYSFVPLKSFKRAIVVYYTTEDAERARIASDRLQIPKTAKSPAVMLRVFRGPQTVLVEDGWFAGSRRDKSGINDDAEEGSWYFGGYPVLSNTFDDEEIKESPFHLRPPVPERNFLISPPGSPPVGWVATREDPPNESPLAQDLVEALERLKAQKASRSRQRRFPGETHRRRASASRSPSLSTDAGSISHSGTEEEDGVMIIPETAAGLTVRVEDWGTRRLARLHQAREKGKRHRENSNSEDAPPAKRSKSEEAEDGSEEERQRGALSEMEEELDKELDVGRYSHPMMDWNKFDHARTRVSNTTWKANDGSNMEIQVEMENDSEGDDDDVSNTPFLAQNQMFASGRSIKVKMPKLGVKPKPASLPPVMPELDLPGQGSPMLGFKPTSMPPLRPTAMPPNSSDGTQ